MASLAACASKEEAEAQFEKLVHFVLKAIQFMPNYRSLFLCNFLKFNVYGVLWSIYYSTFCSDWRSKPWPSAAKVTSDGLVVTSMQIAECRIAECRMIEQISMQVSVLVRGKETIEVGSVALQGDYFSRRLMIRQKAGDDSLQPLYTASMQLSITRLLACILELSQGDSERLAEFKALLAWSFRCLLEFGDTFLPLNLE